MLKLESYEEDPDYEANVYNYEALIEFTFLLPNSDTTKYQTVIDSYIQAFVKKIKATPQYNASATFKLEVKTVGAQDLNKFDDGEFKPTLKLTGQIIDI